VPSGNPPASVRRVDSAQSLQPWTLIYDDELEQPIAAACQLITPSTERRMPAIAGSVLACRDPGLSWGGPGGPQIDRALPPECEPLGKSLDLFLVDEYVVRPQVRLS
jgi:hypothetical protein